MKITGRKLGPNFALKIGVCGLASPSEPVRFRRALREINRLGHEVKVPFDPSKFYGSKRFLFGCASVSTRVRALEELFSDKSVHAIVSSRGGYSSMELLGKLNYSKIEKNPKPFVGFSDITAILVALYQKSGVPVIHGPGIEGGFGEYSKSAERKKSADTLLALLEGDLPDILTKLPGKLLAGRNREARAPIVGGNLAILASLLGTSYQLDCAGKILFLEDVGEKPYRIHRQLMQLRLAGCFKKVKGIYLGNFSNCIDPNKNAPTMLEVVKDSFREAPFPVVGFGPFGHEALNLPLPFGVSARLSGKGLELLSAMFHSR